MRFLRFLKILIVVTVSLSAFSASAQNVPDSHEIILKLANSPMVAVPKTNLVSLKIPASWESQVEPGESVIFRVPFHPGVTGKIEKLSELSSIESDVHVLDERYHTEFHVESQNPIEIGAFSGYQATLTGRLGGELWKVRLYSGTIAQKFHIRFYAQSPDFWFHIYMEFFDEILQSIQIME